MNAGSQPRAPGARDTFIAELQHWRKLRGLSQKQLAVQMGYDPSHISKIEGGHHRPTEGFAKRADTVLHAWLTILRRWREYDASERAAVVARRAAARDCEDTTEGAGEPAHTGLTPGQLLVEHDEARLRYTAGTYHALMRKTLANLTDAPITRFLIRVAVDRFPEDPSRSNRYYRENPLTLAELDLTASCGGEPMEWEVKLDRDAFKEFWLLFRNPQARFPLYPSESASIEYTYTVSDHKWGNWFQRAVRLPTRLGDRGASLADPLPPGVDVPEATRYVGPGRLSDRLRAIGIRQEGDPILREPCTTFDLPREAEKARDLHGELLGYMDLIHSLYPFVKGMGLAAPQIGVSRALAVVQAPDEEPITLLNPQVVRESGERDQKYEGCLSFFDVRGLVSRALCMRVRCATWDGEDQLMTLKQGVARLAAHEIDHLHGTLYLDRLSPATAPVPLTEYDGSGEAWRY